LHIDNKKIYIALNKPLNVVTTNIGRKGDKRQTVRDLVPYKGHLFTIGRLDAESDGLIVLTNDGDLTYKLTHPSFAHTKTYKVVVYGIPAPEIIEEWETGVYIEDEETHETTKTAPCSVKIVKRDGGLATLRIVMTEGKNRQIRRVARKLGFPVRRLTRTHIGQLELGELKPGEWRELTPQEIKLLSTSDPTAGSGRRAPRSFKRRPSAAGGPAKRTGSSAPRSPAPQGQRGRPGTKPPMKKKTNRGKFEQNRRRTQ
jgi:pseudouridine synthase